MSSYRGTSINQDSRFSNKMESYKQKMKFSRVLKKKIDFKKIKLFVLKEWICNTIIRYMSGDEDEIVINYVFSMLEQGEDKIKPKEMQIYLTGFMEDNARKFMKELWKFLDEAQKSEVGIPRRLIQEEKKNILKERLLNELSLS